jgi:chorismate synthase
MLRFLTAGESHGRALVAFLEGLPAGLPVDLQAVNNELAKRQKGYGRSNRQKLEKDEAQILGGIRSGITTGAPIALMIANKDAENWQYVMSVEKPDMTLPEAQEQFAQKAITRFRPGHADLAGTVKYHQTDVRDVLERASARETASRVAVGALCEQLLRRFGVITASHVLQIGRVQSSLGAGDLDLDELSARAEQSEVCCIDPEASEKMKELIQEMWQAGDTLGGVIEVRAANVPVGLGSYTQWDKKIDGKLAQALLSVQAIKAMEIGDGTAGAGRPGSQVHDALYPGEEGSDLPFTRETNHAGGLEGGMTNGDQLVVRAFMKPIPTMRAGLDSLAFPSFEAERAHYERSDVCAVPAASIVCKAMVNIVLAECMLEKFGGDNLAEVEGALTEYREYCRRLGKKQTGVGSAKRKPQS